MSAITFSFGHIIFHNWVAVIPTLFGGYYFASSYAKTKSLLLVTLEHGLYGVFIFTIGLGNYFYHKGIETLPKFLTF